MVRQLHRSELIDGANNVVLIGGPGTGKAHIATALGIQAVEHHRKNIRFRHRRLGQRALAGLSNEQGKAAGRAATAPRSHHPRRAQLPAVQSSGSALLFYLLSKFYESPSVIITINWSFSEWWRSRRCQDDHRIA